MKEKIKNLFDKERIGYTAGIFVLIIAIVLFISFETLGLETDKKTQTFHVDKLFDISKGLVGQGVIETKEVNINAKVPGRVIKIYVEEGQKVKAGDPLFEISSEELKAKKAQAEAAVVQAEAALKAAKEQYTQAEAGVKASNGLVEQAKAGVTAAKGKMNEAKAGVKAAEKQEEAATAIKEKADKGAREQEIAQAQVAYNIMKASYDRIVLLEEKGAVSKQKLEEVKAQLDVAEQTLSMAKEGARVEDKKAATATSQQAQAGVEASKTRVEQAEAGERAAEAQLTQAIAGVQSSNALLYQAKAGVEAKEGLVAQAKGALAEVEAYLDEVIIKAPMDGTVTAVHSEEGELVSTGTQMGVVSNLQGAWAEINVKETDLGKIVEHQKVSVKVPAYPDKTFTGEVVTINESPSFAVKRATNDNGDFDIVSFGVKVKLDNDEGILRPGMSAFIQFVNN
ncbi:hypothetical protein CS063_13295 [Sporanaerobium hydrogeniformans]|uniref:Uncharacterized protein n=1 Tax=Sporanaerobium hydrogeniformans TaxID=3072179 RepID=A0AC61DBD2_9FIRM|nr:efflux RND transporter periplasmic adaptor subunit [Sporanaerobium hydrogeniformans]PHV69951.1 hypothetical protein CS063_13295 [Sporanaerobium hydrogeniformans]